MEIHHEKPCRLAVGIKFKRKGRFIRLVSLVAVDICISLIDVCTNKYIYISICLDIHISYTYMN